MKTFPVAALLLSTGVLSGALLAAQATRPEALEIYIVDTEGGKAALYVSPTGQSLLIDSGNPGGRDTDRIVAALSDAGVTQIDYLLSTHYHVDHVGGLRELAVRVPIRHFVDHGPTAEAREQVAGFQAAYADLFGKAARTIVKPGDRVPITGLDWRIVTAGGDVLKTPLPGGGRPNAACAQFARPESPAHVAESEDARSVGSVITLGRFRAIDLGDLLAVKEGELMCPANPIGSVDVYFATSHGAAASGSGALVHGVQPRVAVVHNGPRKGGAASALQIVRTSPGLEDVWQSHWSDNAALEQNSAGVFIANLDDPATIAGVLTTAPGTSAAPPRATGSSRNAAAAHTPAFWIKVSARSDGTFTVTNSRNGFSKTYVKHPAAR